MEKNGSNLYRLGVLLQNNASLLLDTRLGKAISRLPLAGNSRPRTTKVSLLRRWPGCSVRTNGKCSSFFALILICAHLRAPTATHLETVLPSPHQHPFPLHAHLWRRGDLVEIKQWTLFASGLQYRRNDHSEQMFGDYQRVDLKIRRSGNWSYPGNFLKIFNQSSWSCDNWDSEQYCQLYD